LLSGVLAAEKEGEDVVIGKKIRIPSAVLGEERMFYLHLPESYEKSENRYPVLYVLDGRPSTLAGAFFTARWLSYEQMPEMIIVAVANTDRDRDMIPVKHPRRPTSGGSDNFLRFLSEELIPFVDQNYRTEKFRILSGTSNSALFAVYAFLADPEPFYGYIASSPMLGHCYEFMFDMANKFFSSREKLKKALFMVYGKSDSQAVVKTVPYFTTIVERAKPEGFEYAVKIIEDEGHVPHGSLFYGLRFIFKNYVYSREKALAGGLEVVKIFYSKLSNRYGFSVKIPLVTLLDLGNDLLAKEETDRALEVFLFCLSQYPVDPNAHYFLGEGYLKSGNKQKALFHYTKALELDPEYPPARGKIESLKKDLK
jgi:predicted alpha/beta superfamily hydrolase